MNKNNNKQLAIELNKMMSADKIVSNMVEQELLGINTYEIQSKIDQITTEVYGQVMRSFNNAFDDYLNWLRRL